MQSETPHLLFLQLNQLSSIATHCTINLKVWHLKTSLML